MKQYYLAMLFSILMIASASGQFQLGIKAGANFADFNNTEFLQDNNVQSAMTTHWHIGVSSLRNFGDRFSLAAELLYSVKGVQSPFEFSVPNSDEKTVVGLEYLSLPIMLYYKPNEKISIGTGIEAGYLLNARLSAPNGSRDVNFIYDKKEELALNLGFRFNFTPALFLDGRYQWGLTSINDLILTDANGAPVEEVNLKNRVIQVSIGYFIIR